MTDDITKVSYHKHKILKTFYFLKNLIPPPTYNIQHSPTRNFLPTRPQPKILHRKHIPSKQNRKLKSHVSKECENESFHSANTNRKDRATEEEPFNPKPYIPNPTWTPEKLAQSLKMTSKKSATKFMVHPPKMKTNQEPTSHVSKTVPSGSLLTTKDTS